MSTEAVPLEAARLELCQRALEEVCACALDIRDLCRDLGQDQGAAFRTVERMALQMGAIADAALRNTGAPGMMGSTDRWILSAQALGLIEAMPAAGA